MTDHGTQFYAVHPNANQNNTKFRKYLNHLSIKHYLARINRPQTNGKVERFGCFGFKCPKKTNAYIAYGT